MKRVLPVLLVPFMVAVMSTAAFAANAHLKQHDGPTFTDNDVTLSMTVSYVGLGNFNTKQTLIAQGNVTATCTNPAGATQPPGQNPAPVTLGGTTVIPAANIKNGNVTITTTTNAPTSPIVGAPGCPNTKWTETITDVAFTSATFTLIQDTNGDGVYDEAAVVSGSCTFSSPTTNGLVPSSNVTCTIT
jgi:hypothetical protein